MAYGPQQPKIVRFYNTASSSIQGINERIIHAYNSFFGKKVELVGVPAENKVQVTYGNCTVELDMNRKQKPICLDNIVNS